MAVDPALGMEPRGGRTRQQLPEEVASYVRELIITGKVAPGEFLRMDRIAEAVGVSTTPVREGLLALRAEGFVRQVPRRGFIVESFTRQDIRDLFWAQGVLAGELAARAATEITPEELTQLAQIDDLYTEALARNDAEALSSLGHQFHRSVNLAARSNRLAFLLGSVVRHLPNRFYTDIEGHVSGTHDEHQALLAALKKRDPKRARALMQTHLSKGADRLIATLERRGVWAAESVQ